MIENITQTAKHAVKAIVFILSTDIALACWLGMISIPYLVVFECSDTHSNSSVRAV